MASLGQERAKGEAGKDQGGGQECSGYDGSINGHHLTKQGTESQS